MIEIEIEDRIGKKGIIRELEKCNRVACLGVKLLHLVIQSLYQRDWRFILNKDSQE